MELPDHPGLDGESYPGLVILTGASHTGKTSVARALLRAAAPPAAFLSVDEVILDTLARSPGAPWSEVPLAYELLQPQVELLLERGWLVVFESTFTYVPRTGTPEFHADAMERLIAAADRRGIPRALVQLVADEDVTHKRALDTGRLSDKIVSSTVKLHEEAEMPRSTLRLEVGEATPDELALRVAEGLHRPSGPA